MLTLLFRLPILLAWAFVGIVKTVAHMFGETTGRR